MIRINKTIDRPNEPQTQKLAAMLDKKVRRKIPKPSANKFPSGRVKGNSLDRNRYSKYTASESDRYASIGTTGDFIPPNQRMLAKLQKNREIEKRIRGLKKSQINHPDMDDIYLGTENVNDFGFQVREDRTGYNKHKNMFDEIPVTNVKIIQ